MSHSLCQSRQQLLLMLHVKDVDSFPHCFLCDSHRKLQAFDLQLEKERQTILATGFVIRFRISSLTNLMISSWSDSLAKTVQSNLWFQETSCRDFKRLNHNNRDGGHDYSASVHPSSVHSIGSNCLLDRNMLLQRKMLFM